MDNINITTSTILLPVDCKSSSGVVEYIDDKKVYMIACSAAPMATMDTNMREYV